MKKNITSLLLFISLTAHASDIIGGIDIPNLSTPECMEIKYSPAPIYSAPEGKKVGILVLDNPQLALTDKLSCDIRPVIQSKINNINKNLDVIEISYSHLVPAVYQIVKNTHTWFKIKNGDNYLWLKKESHWKYVSYEQDLVQGIQTVEEFCIKLHVQIFPLALKT